MSKSLALVGLRVLDDARFAREVTHRGSCAIGSSLLTFFAWLRRCLVAALCRSRTRSRRTGRRGGWIVYSGDDEEGGRDVMYLVSFVAAIYGLVLVCYVSAVEVRQARRGKARRSEAAVTRR